VVREIFTVCYTVSLWKQGNADECPGDTPKNLYISQSVALLRRSFTVSIV